MIEKNEVITAINDYLFGTGDEQITKAEVIEIESIKTRTVPLASAVAEVNAASTEADGATNPKHQQESRGTIAASYAAFRLISVSNPSRYLG